MLWTFAEICKMFAWNPAIYTPEILLDWHWRRPRRKCNCQRPLSNNCPQIYCATATKELNVSLSKPDKQCKHSRTGVVCGQYPKGKSVAYNLYACKDCTIRSILLLIPLLIAGPVLIALICCLNLTVSVGTLKRLSVLLQHHFHQYRCPNSWYSRQNTWEVNSRTSSICWKRLSVLLQHHFH